MTGFVSTGNNAPTDATIDNDGFFPAIDPSDFRAAARQDGTTTPERLQVALLGAMDEVNRELAYYKATQQAAGYTQLADVPASKLNNESLQLQRYRRAVYAIAKALLLERLRDYDTTGKGGDNAEENGDLEAIHRRDARWAIADFLAKPRLVSELI